MNLNHYQQHLLFLFFNEMEDKMAEICEGLETILLEKMAEATDAKMNKLYKRSKEFYEEFEAFAGNERERLKKEGIPYILTDPVTLYLTTRIKLSAEKHLQTPQGEA